MSGPRTVRAPRGTSLACKSWLTEAPYRMIQNNLDPDVAENPDELVVYGGRGQAARSWDAFDAILESLKNLEMTKLCWCNPASRLPSSRPIRMHPAY